MEAFTKEILSMGLNTGTDECIIQAATFMKGHGRRIRSTGKEWCIGLIRERNTVVSGKTISSMDGEFIYGLIQEVKASSWEIDMKVSGKMV